MKGGFDTCQRWLSASLLAAVDQLDASLDCKILGQGKDGEKSERGNHRKNKTWTDIHAYLPTVMVFE